MGLTKPIEQYLFSNLLTKIHIVVYLKDIIRGINNMKTYRDFDNYLKNFPNEKGYFGEYGGMILPPELVPAFKDITEAYAEICNNARFINELRRIRKEFQGRPTPVYHCER